MSAEEDEDLEALEVRVVSYDEICIAKVRFCSDCGEYRGEMFSPNSGRLRPIT